MNRKIRKYVTALAAVLCTILYMSFLSFAGEEDPVIRVAFPIQDGLTMKDGNGSYTGYTYDYLKEVAQYTGWNYEFVELEGTVNEQLIQMLDMLENGELDLMGALNYNDQTAERFDFPSENYGNAYTVIAVKEDEDRIDEYNLSDYKNLRIALLDHADNHNELLYQYTKLNGINYEIVWCRESNEPIEAVKSGRADALLAIDLSLPEGFRSVAKFSPRPFYFGTTKGNTHIVNELNRAISYISETNPTLQMNLYNKYFTRSSSKLYLNGSEREYIAQHPVLKVLVHDGFGPIQYYGRDGQIQGVAKDLLDNIARKAGWELEYVYAQDYDQFEQELNREEADIVLSVLYDYDTVRKRNVLLSNPYLETESVLVAREGTDMADLKGKKEAVYKGIRRTYDNQDNVYYYDSLEKSLEAVETGECDFTYSNSYTASYYQRKNRYEHLVIYPQTGSDGVKYSIGILQKDDKQMLAILNKGIRSVDTGELEQYIYNNAQQDQKVTLKSYIIDNFVPFICFILAASSCLLVLVYIHYRSQMKMKKQIELENIRYRYLSDILKEVTFSYDYGKDILTISKEGVEIFGTDASIGNYSRYRSKSRAEDQPSLYLLLEQKQNMDTEILMVRSDQTVQWHRVVIKVIYNGNRADSAVGRIQNIHSEKLEREKLKQRSMRDGLTGIYNISTARREILRLLNEKKGVLALAVIDLDGFKYINDRYGHYIGDQVLIHTAKTLEEVFGEQAVTGRLGGDEFIVCVPYVDRGQMEEACGRLFLSLKTRCEASGNPVVTVSIGIAISRDGDDYTSLYQRADAILYEVKSSGKNSFRIEAAQESQGIAQAPQDHTVS